MGRGGERRGGDGAGNGAPYPPIPLSPQRGGGAAGRRGAPYPPIALSPQRAGWWKGAVAVVAAGCAPVGPAVGPVPSEPPAALAERRIEFPAFRETALANGLRLIVVEHRAQPIVQVNLYVPSGAAADPAQQAGLAGLTADLLTKGTATRTATEISEAIEQVGGTLGASAGVDWITLSSNVLTEHLPLAMELVSESALRPGFPQTEVELSRRRALSALQAALGQPGQIAQRTFDREVYGIEHPYGINPVPGTVERLTRDDVVSFHRRHFGAGNALLVVAGDVQAAEVERMVSRHFGEWQRGTPVTARFPDPVAQERMRIALVHRPGSPQTTLLVGHVGIRPDDPEFFALQVLNGIVGGHADARLFQILREQRGWTYGAYSRFTRPREVGYFSANAEVRPEVTDSALVEMLNQLRRIRDERVTEEELNAAKGFLAGSFPLRIQTAGQIGAQIAQNRLLGLPIEHLTEYRERILAVTADDVQRVAQRYVMPERALIVVVGDARVLLPRLEPIAPVTLYDVAGEPLELPALE
jgi:zinc protease